eukprot:1183720-Rhodomonas_salina.1
MMCVVMLHHGVSNRPRSIVSNQPLHARLTASLLGACRRSWTRLRPLGAGGAGTSWSRERPRPCARTAPTPRAPAPSGPWGPRGPTPGGPSPPA